MLWHRREVADAEWSGQWFAAAHHLAHLHQIADAADNLSALRVRYLRARTLYHTADAKSLQAVTAKRKTEQADAPEQTLAVWYHTLAWPPHAVPWWLGADDQESLLRTLRGAEERLLLQPIKPWTTLQSSEP